LLNFGTILGNCVGF